MCRKRAAAVPPKSVHLGNDQTTTFRCPSGRSLEDIYDVVVMSSLHPPLVLRAAWISESETRPFPPDNPTHQVGYMFLAPDFVAYAQKQHMYHANNNNKKPGQNETPMLLFKRGNVTLPCANKHCRCYSSLTTGACPYDLLPPLVAVSAATASLPCLMSLPVRKNSASNKDATVSTPPTMTAVLE